MNESTPAEHLPCPYCGSSDVLAVHLRIIDGRHRAFCKSCEAMGPIADGEAEAWMRWDIRAKV